MARIKLNTAVGYFLDEINGGEAEFAKAYRMAVRANKNLKYDITGKVVSVCVQVDEDGTAPIPDWLMKVTKVGQLNRTTKKIVAMTENNNISFATSEGDQININFPVSNVFNHGHGQFDYPPHSLGKGGYTNIGEYRLSEEEGIVVLSPETPYKEIWLEGIDTRDKDGDVCVNELLTEAIVAYIRWRWHIAKKGVTAVDKQMYKNEWHTEKSNAKFRIKKPKLQDLNRLARQSNKFLKS